MGRDWGTRNCAGQGTHQGRGVRLERAILRHHGVIVVKRQLPIRRGPIDLPKRRHLFKAGVRVPAADLGKARFDTRAALVVWD